MSSVRSLIGSLIGKKVVMAVTGAVLLLFVLLHMIGNLHFFQGPAELNGYAEFLRTMGAPVTSRGELLWIVRLVTLAALVGHLWAAWAVTRASWAARPVGYHDLKLIETTYAARTMRWGGVLILLFVIYHLLDFTFGRVNPGFVAGDVYRNVVASFSRWPVAVAYLVAMFALCFHMYHGIESGLQTLGANHPRYNGLRRGFAIAYAVIVAAGFASVPVAVLAGWTR
ncbi:MAG TPA: succinate dehydrogenase cytochrome b subunit [Gemmatimonadales bacterium]